MAGVDLVVHVLQRRAHDVCAGLRVRPGRAVNPGLQRMRHQPVVVLVVGDLIDAVALPVEGLQLGLVGVGAVAPGDDLLTTGARAVRAQRFDAPFAALALDGLDQRGVALEGVVVLQRWRLIGDLVRGGEGVGV